MEVEGCVVYCRGGGRIMTTVTIAGHRAVPSDLGGDTSRGGLVSFCFIGPKAAERFNTDGPRRRLRHRQQPQSDHHKLGLNSIRLIPPAVGDPSYRRNAPLGDVVVKQDVDVVGGGSASGRLFRSF